MSETEVASNPMDRVQQTIERKDGDERERTEYDAFCLAARFVKEEMLVEAQIAANHVLPGNRAHHMQGAEKRLLGGIYSDQRLGFSGSVDEMVDLIREVLAPQRGDSKAYELVHSTIGEWIKSERSTPPPQRPTE